MRKPTLAIVATDNPLDHGPNGDTAVSTDTSTAHMRQPYLCLDINENAYQPHLIEIDNARA